MFYDGQSVYEMNRKLLKEQIAPTSSLLTTSNFKRSSLLSLISNDLNKQQSE